MTRFLPFFTFLVCFGSLHSYDLNKHQALDELFFSEFKRDPIAGKYFEPVSAKEGSAYAKELRMDLNELLPLLSQFKTNDELGNPKTFVYTKFGRISPSTLRWIRTAGELKKLYGSMAGFKVLYFGAGYGGVCKILADMGMYPEMVLVQGEGEGLLCAKYLHRMGVYNTTSILFEEIGDPLQYDLVIVDADFVDRIYFDGRLDPILQSIPRGYVIKRGVADQFNSIIADFISIGRKGKVCAELLDDENVRQKFYWKPVDGDIFEPLPPEVVLKPQNCLQAQSALSNEVTEHRLGDQLLTYFRTKWIARKMEIPFLLTPFKFSQEFALHANENKTGKGFLYKKKKMLFDLEEGLEQAVSTLWVLPFVPLSKYEYVLQNRRAPYVELDWDHPEVRQMVADALVPNRKVDEVMPPPGMLSIALHLRKGGAFKQDDLVKEQLPLKFPSDAFMLQQLKRIAKIFPDSPLYIFIFTDDLDPAGLARHYAEKLNEPRAVFDFRKTNHLSADEKMLSDFYSFKNFDCLLRPISHFSFIAGKLGRFSLEISPYHYYMNNEGECVYDQTELYFSGGITK